jgi:pyruvate/2-oxoacid:ferredoxin oxidoreductase beta subunit
MEKLNITNAPMLCSGHAACPGCVEALSVRHVLATMGPDTMAVVPPSCMAIICGLRRALDAQGKHETHVIVLAGDGGTYDIGFQCLSSAAERNENILYICLDNEGYMNTGAQKSSSTPHYAKTGTTPAGKTTRKKNITAIMAAHQVPYAATASVGYLPDLIRKVEKAKSIRGFRMITLLVPCLDGWGLADDGGLTASRYAVESGAFPLYEVQNGTTYTLNHTPRTRPVSDYLKLQRRYQHLPEAGIASLQAEIDEGWNRLQRQVEMSASA